jgi:hypothetical protein
MNEMKHGHHQHVGPNSDGIHHDRRPYWKCAHRDWRFWIGVVLMLAAMFVYLMSDDLSLRPRLQPQRPVSGAVGK